jgi:hypothetical protein
MSTDNQPKAQHYIPNFYLKGFTDKRGRLRVYERAQPLRESKPKHEAYRPDYYTHSDAGQRDETVEGLLKKIESLVAPIVRKLANPQYVLTAENSEYLVVFVSFMFSRVPAWREYLDRMAVAVARSVHVKTASDKTKFHQLCADFERKTGKAVGSYEDRRKHILEGDYRLTQESAGFNLSSMMKSACFLMDELANFDYQVLYAPTGKNFWTSDSPVFTLKPENKREASVGMGFGWPGVEVYFPLNKHACLKLKRAQGSGGFQVTGQYVDDINRLTMATATRHLYACEGLRRTARLFDERGCKVPPGQGSFMPRPPQQYQYLARG